MIKALKYNKLLKFKSLQFLDKWNVVFCVGPKGYQYLSTYDIFDKIKHSLFMCDVPGVISRKESIDYKSFVLHLYYPTLMNIFL